MATSYSFTRNGIFEGLAAERHSADYAARPVVTSEQKAQDIAQRFMAAIKADRRDEARALALELKPLLGLLPEGK